jgi:site-specific DNA-cytosine methylase
MEKKFIVISLFNGMGCIFQALDRIGVNVSMKISSEIDKYANIVNDANYPETIQVGSVCDISIVNDNGVKKLIYPLGEIILNNDEIILCGGSPCQSFSFAGKRKGMSTKCEQEILTLEHYLELKNEGFEFEGQSYLFWEFMRLLNEVKPKYFMLENVEMGEKWEKVLRHAIQVPALHINSALVCAQNRRRVYFTNIGMQPMGLFGDMESIIQQPKDKGILLKDILESDVDEKYFLSDKALDGIMKHKQEQKEKGFGFGAVIKDENEKMNSLKIGGKGVDDLVKVGQVGFKKEFVESEKAQALLQRDYKGMSNYGINVVVHNMQKRSADRPSIEKNKNAGGSGHLSRADGKTYCLDTACTMAVEFKQSQVERVLERTGVDISNVTEPTIFDVYNKKLKDDGKCITLTDPCHNNLRLVVPNLTNQTEEIVAMRGRPNKDGVNVQQLEANGTGKSNTLTSVQKDNLVISSAVGERKVNQVNTNNKSNGGTQPYQQDRIYDVNGISPALQAQLSSGSAIINTPRIRRLTPLECKRLQTVDDNYLMPVSDTQIYKQLGNGWTVDVIAHIFSYMKF